MSTPTPTRKRSLEHIASVVVLTLAIVALAGFGFKEKGPAAQTGGNGDRDFPRVALPINKDELPEQYHPLIDYLAAMDPTIMTEPCDINPLLARHDVDLYARRQEFQRRRRPLQTASADIPAELPHIFKDLRVTQPIRDARDTLEEATWRSVALGPIPKDPKVVFRKGVYLTDEDGVPLKDLPPLPASSVKVANLVAHGPTILSSLPPMKNDPGPFRIARALSAPRIRVLLTSGNAELDGAAVAHLRRFVGKLAAGAKNQRRDAWLSAPKTIVVNWEHFPGISYRPDFKSRLQAEPDLQVPWYDLNQH